MNPNTTLCLACSSSLPPRLLKLAPPSPTPPPNEKQTSLGEPALFFTRCCSRPICPSCLSINPRLARYDPCLACLGGAHAVGSRSAIGSSTKQPEPRNVDGSVRDEDVFAVGDEDEDEEDEEEEKGSSSESRRSVTPPPAYEAESATIGQPEKDGASELPAATADHSEASSPSPTPGKYYISPGDTLLGISLRYGVDGRTLCRLNALPPSTLSTTPHLLHTRTFVTLPPPAKTPPGNRSDPACNAEEDKERAHARVVERAQKRFQFVTKEVDWRIAQAYVALAESEPEPERSDKLEGKKVVPSPPPDGSSGDLECRAVDRYLDDDEWEEQERREGRGVRIERFPLGRGEISGKGKASVEGKRW